MTGAGNKNIIDSDRKPRDFAVVATVEGEFTLQWRLKAMDNSISRADTIACCAWSMGAAAGRKRLGKKVIRCEKMESFKMVNCYENKEMITWAVQGKPSHVVTCLFGDWSLVIEGWSSHVLGWWRMKRPILSAVVHRRESHFRCTERVESCAGPRKKKLKKLKEKKGYPSDCSVRHRPRSRGTRGEAELGFLYWNFDFFFWFVFLFVMLISFSFSCY